MISIDNLRLVGENRVDFWYGSVINSGNFSNFAQEKTENIPSFQYDTVDTTGMIVFFLRETYKSPFFLIEKFNC